MAAKGTESSAVPVKVVRTGVEAPERLALGFTFGFALADVALATESAPRAKAPAATPASVRLPKRIALDNAFPFGTATYLKTDVGT